MFRSAVVAILALASLNAVSTKDAAVDRLGPTLQNVRLFAMAEGDKLWPGHGNAPFGFLLISGDHETLLCQDPTPAGFTADGTDPATGCARETRPRSGLPDNLLAAIPFFGERETIVMGAPETTGRSRAEWVRTILHEHFHQYEATFPDYFSRTTGLGLQGDKPGSQWMLDYPFPHSNPKVGAAYDSASNALADALAMRGKPNFLSAFDRYLFARKAFERTVSARDWRYLEFQLWQEGTARWTEITLGERYHDPDVRAGSVALGERALANLRTPDLKAQGRELVYPYGAGEAMLMDACGPGWRGKFRRVLSMGPLLDDAQKSCTGQR